MAQILLWALLTSSAQFTESMINSLRLILKSLGLNPIDGADFTLGSVDFLCADYLK